VAQNIENVELTYKNIENKGVKYLFTYPIVPAQMYFLKNRFEIRYYLLRWTVSRQFCGSILNP
jgi:hypothetical protein